MTQRQRAEILWSHLQKEGVKGDKVQEIECIIDALIDCHAAAIEWKSAEDAKRLGSAQ